MHICPHFQQSANINLCNLYFPQAVWIVDKLRSIAAHNNL